MRDPNSKNSTEPSFKLFYITIIPSVLETSPFPRLPLKFQSLPQISFLLKKKKAPNINYILQWTGSGPGTVVATAEATEDTRLWAGRATELRVRRQRLGLTRPIRVRIRRAGRERIGAIWNRGASRTRRRRGRRGSTSIRSTQSKERSNLLWKRDSVGSRASALRSFAATSLLTLLIAPRITGRWPQCWCGEIWIIIF